MRIDEPELDRTARMRWIVVAGAPRSGTTFVGRVLSQGLRTNVLIEPFNPNTGDAGFPVPFCRARSRDEAKALNIDDHVQRVMKFAYHVPRRATRDTRRPRALAKRIIGNRASWSHEIARINLFARMTVIKDPTATLMLPYLTGKYGMQAVLLVRHPLSFYASFKRLGWRGSRQLELLTRQASLLSEIRGVFPDFELSVIRDELASTVWLWRVMTELGLRDARSNFRINCYSHEELSANPVRSFAEMHDSLGLVLSRARLGLIHRLTHASQADVRGSPHILRRASASIFQESAGRVDAGERRRIEQAAGKTAVALYGDQAFNLDVCVQKLVAGERFMDSDAV